ncbi:hypothetical protein [Streptomyces albipurpureus]|uniref:Uncharacterized protein n=1 Tax=Streptomyces albipurpureus TaxID=2897419 RepID=A0ABT0UR32_9ACTN|nr:hypothetical protein [Streptomyces sp. CWNU-1]MCM2390085.1 hypothetical protein [Streptomyces sp. CWNU-1]
MTTTPELGDVVRDTSNKNRIGRVMGHEGPYYQLRPLNGGVEWDALPEHLVPAEQSDAMSAAVAEVNAHSRWGL